MSRRTTLGALSHNSLNGRATASRTSMGAAAKRSSLAGGGGSRLSLNPNASSKRSSMAPPTGRTSLAPRPSLAGGGRKSSTGVRRSSAFGTGSGKQDPRPVGDRSFQNACIRNLVEYLSDHGYDQPISAKILTRPSGRDFNNIMGFLFRQYDRMWQPTPGTRFEEAVIPFLKAAGYPFTLSKASLAAVGAPQTWPKVLAAISWMIELLAYDEEVRAFEADQSERRASGQALDGVADGALDDRAFFEYLGLAYRCFLDGDDDQYIALEEELSGTFEDQSAALAAHAQLLQTRNDELRAEIEAVRGRTKRLPELKQRRSDLKSDLVKFQQLVEQLNSHKASLESKVESRLAEEERLKREAASLRDQIAGLRDKIANQELSAEDVNRMGRERQRLREGMAAAVDAKAAAQKRCWEGEVQLSKSIEALEEAVHSYDAKARTLHLVPTDAKNANGMDYGLSVNKEAIEMGDGVDILTNNVRHHICPSLTAIKEAVAQRMHAARQQLLDLLDAEEASEEELNELVDVQQNLEARTKRGEDAYKKEKEALESALAEKESASEAIERRLEELRDHSELERRRGRGQAEAARLRLDLAEHQAAAEKERAALHESLVSILHVASDHKAEVGLMLERLTSAAADAISSIDAEGMPGWIADVMQEEGRRAGPGETEEITDMQDLPPPPSNHGKSNGRTHFQSALPLPRALQLM